MQDEMDSSEIHDSPPPYWSSIYGPGDDLRKAPQVYELPADQSIELIHSSQAEEISTARMRPAAIPLETLKSRVGVIDCPRCRMRAETDIEQYDTGVTL